jgi:hypothetical protein
MEVVYGGKSDQNDKLIGPTVVVNETIDGELTNFVFEEFSTDEN